jgi:imidazolonepropionase
MITLIENIALLAGIRSETTIKVSGKDMAQLPAIENAYIIIEDGIIKAFGSGNYTERVDKVIDAEGGTVLPAWCDSHTHIVYAGSREKEFVDKINGLSYEAIAKKGGGILNSAEKLQHADAAELFDKAMERLAEMQQFGTGAVEIKSGYGLNLESELKMLRVIKKLKAASALTIKATFLGAHALPKAYLQNRSAYIKLLTEELLPQIAHEGLADFIDVFCDEGFFTVAETDIILSAGAKYGLPPKIHANELALSGGVQVGVKHHALSVDHLECMSDAEIEVLKASDTMPTLLPSTAFYLNIPFAPARQLIDAGLPVALASDYNPGSSPSGNMNLVIALACIKMKMLPEESLNAATLNSAYAMNIATTHGSITPGKKANLIITKPLPSLAYIPYSFGSNLVKHTLLNGIIA